MDPNLQKFCTVHDREILRGDLKAVLSHAHHYLSCIHGHDRTAATKEFRKFRSHVKRLVPES